ncbi:MAG: hypothetical protein ACUVXF_04500 [Desulfobaccales bacterium]
MQFSRIWGIGAALCLGLVVAAAGEQKGEFLAKYATLEFYVHQQLAPGCGIALAHSKPPIFLYLDEKGQILPESFTFPAIVEFHYRCADCSADGDVEFYLKEAKFKKVSGKKMLYIKIKVDNNAELRCHPGNPLNNQKFSASSFTADFTIPWEHGYVFSQPGMWYHFALRLPEK